MSSHRGCTIAEDFLSIDDIPVLIRRTTIRAYIYDCVYLDGIINDVSKRSVNMVMNYFKLAENDRNKIKNMIKHIIKRNNDNMPSIWDIDSEVNANLNKRKLKAIMK